MGRSSASGGFKGAEEQRGYSPRLLLVKGQNKPSSWGAPLLECGKTLRGRLLGVPLRYDGGEASNDMFAEGDCDEVRRDAALQ